MASRWVETIDEEWWAEGMGVVLEARGVVYYGDSDERAALGPFRSRLEAERALEEARDDAATDDP
jgi:hypothetical protein